MGKTLLQKVWDLHTVRTLPTGQTQLFVGLHLVHEVTTPQAFDALRARGWKVARPDRTFATVDHIVPTRERTRPFLDVLAEDMIAALERNTPRLRRPSGRADDDRQGIVHVIGPELGLTQPGMTIACGDSHTSTHGAFGAVAFGIGTSQVRDVLASQCLAMEPLKVRRIRVNGTLPAGVYAKDVILTIIQRLGVSGGVGYAYEYAGDAIERMTMDERMTICNMSIEGGARVGYVNPDQTTFDYLKGRPFAPSGDAFERGPHVVASIASDPDARYDDEVVIKAEELTPVVTWGVNPGQSIAVERPHPVAARCRRRGAGGDRCARLHGSRRRPADCRHARRRRVHRLLHQLAAVGPPRGGAHRPRPPRRAARQGARRAGFGVGQARGRERRARRDLPRGRLRVARAPAARCASA